MSYKRELITSSQFEFGNGFKYQINACTLMRTCAVLFQHAKVVNVDTTNGIVTTLEDGTSRVRRFRFDNVKSEESAGDLWQMNEDVDLDDEEEDDE